MIPSVNQTIEDGALGILPPNTSGANVKVGVCSQGTPGALISHSDKKALTRALGRGPLVEAVALVLDAGGPVYTVAAAPTIPGTLSAVSHLGPGTGTVTPSIFVDRQLTVKVSTAGALGTAAFQFQVDGGGYGAPVLSDASAPWDELVPGMLTTIRFPAGTYVIGETYTWRTNGTTSFRNAGDTGAATGPSPSLLAAASSPVDAYDVLVDIVTDGGLGAGAFVYSVDGGNNFSAPIAIPSAGTFGIPQTGILLTFAGTFTSGDEYSFSSTAAGCSSADAMAAVDVATASNLSWDHVHVVGEPASAAAAVALAAALDAKMMAAETAYRYAYGLVECPSGDDGADDATIAAAAANFASVRVGIGAGDAAIISALDGRVMRRNAVWVATPRISKIPISQDPAWVGAGPLSAVKSLYRDEAVSQFLDEQRFITLRTHKGKEGYFITNFRVMAPGGSDYTYGVNRRVMDTGCRIARAAELPYLVQDVNTNPKTGGIAEKDAQQIEADIGGQLLTGLGANVSAPPTVVLNRSVNLLSGAGLPVTIRLLPKSYLREIDSNIGFINPALSV